MALTDKEMVEAVEGLHRLAGEASAAAYGLEARRGAEFPPNLQLIPVVTFLSAVYELQQKFFADVQD